MNANLIKDFKTVLLSTGLRRPSPPLHVVLNGRNKLLQEIGDTAPFKKALEALLRIDDFAGEFVATIQARAKGQPFTQGLKLGSPLPSNESVIITWQEGEEGSCFTFFLAAPIGMRAIEFHQILDKSQQAEAAVVPGKDDAVTNSAQNALTKEEVLQILQTVLPQTTNAGVVPKQLCIEALEQMGRNNPEGDLEGLVASEYLTANQMSSSSLVRISPQTLSWVRAISAEPEAPVSVETPVPTRALVSEAKRFHDLVSKAAAFRKLLPTLKDEVERLTKTIAEATARLKEIEPQIKEAESFLRNDEIRTAEITLADLRSLLGKE